MEIKQKLQFKYDIHPKKSGTYGLNVYPEITQSRHNITQCCAMWSSMINNDKPVLTATPNSLSNAAKCLSYKIYTFHITQDKFDVHVTMHHDKFPVIKPTRCTKFSNLFLERNSTRFGQFLCPSSRVFRCTHSNGMSYRFADSLQAGSGWNILILLASCQQTCMTYHCCLYSGKLLMMDRGTVRNM